MLKIFQAQKKNKNQTELTGKIIRELQFFNIELLIWAKSGPERKTISDWEYYKQNQGHIEFYTGLPTLAQMDVVENFVVNLILYPVIDIA